MLIEGWEAAQKKQGVRVSLRSVRLKTSDLRNLFDDFSLGKTR